LDERVERVPVDRAGRSAAALQLLIEEAGRLNRRFILLVDNLDIVLDRLDREQEWTFRRVISQEPAIQFIGASSRVMEALYQYDRAFYDFFQVHELKGLDDSETFAMLRRLGGDSGEAEVDKLIQERPGRIRALRLLAGGNPRTLVLLFRVLTEARDGDVQRDIEQLLDLYTPLYKARFEELPAQAQQLVDAMAIHWDPLTAADLTELLRPLSVNQVSAQLKRLEDLGVVEKAPWFGEKKTAFQITERFFNIWYLMRASRRVRRRLLWLVKFLEAWFDREERATTATLSIVQHAKQLVTDERDTQFLLAQSLTLSSKWHEASPLLEQLARGDSEFPSMGLFRAIVETGQIADAVAILERTGADQRWRPLYEALRAAGAGSPDYLNRVAPEVRTVAMEILREIAPRLFSAYSVV
jgi:DNA-binding transcriptional regulator GbsR (MarR family)